jgi:F-type H+-transporting ATPase subunit delta
MSILRISSRYAKSLFDLALEQNILDKVHHDMKLMADICKNSPELLNCLKSPVINGDKKQAVLDSLFAKSFTKLTMLFIQTVIRKRREQYLVNIAEEFLVLYREHKNIQQAHITSASPLSSKVKNELKENLEKQTGKTIEIETQVDPKLIGGIRIQVGDKLFDDSIATQLNNLRLHMR